MFEYTFSLVKYTPKPKHVSWFKELVENLEVNGVWYTPSLGITFRKTADKTMTLEQITAPEALMPTVEVYLFRTTKIGKKLGIKVDITNYQNKVVRY